jgi:hypothetical protein
MDRKQIGILPLALALASCATVVRGVHDDLQVISTPAGADVRLSTGETGVTPVTFVKSRREDFQVTVSKPGYTSQTITVRSSASATGAAATAANIASGGPIGLAVDAGTGAWNSLYPNPVLVQLKPLPPGPRLRTKRIGRAGYPIGTPSSKSGFVHSPYTRRLYDVHAVPHGALVHDVDADKLFVNP